MIMYCKKCGRIIITNRSKNEQRTILPCDCCHSNMYEVPENIYDDELDVIGKNSELRKLITDKFIKSSPEFDEQLFNSRDEILAKENAKYDQAMKIGNAIRQGADPKTVFQTGGQNIPKCPTCGSSNIKKISTASKIAGATMFGLFSRTAKSQFKCENCGYKW